MMDQVNRAATSPVAHTPSGGLRGRREGPVNVFRGVPYAAAPLGDLRWKAPQPFPAWDGLREAAEFVVDVPIQGEAAATDLDTPEAWAAWRAAAPAV